MYRTSLLLVGIQPDDVSEILGEDGKNLRGRQVKYDKEMNEKTIDITTESFSVGGDRKTVRALEKRRLNAEVALVEEIWIELIALHKLGTGEMARIRSQERCTHRMRGAHTRVGHLSDKVDGLPTELKVFVGGPLGSLKLCVSCSENLAPGACEDVKEQMQWAKKELLQARFPIP